MIVELLGLGFKGYFTDPYNIFDFLVILISIVDITVEYSLAA
jgi:hypothetical protein